MKTQSKAADRRFGVDLFKWLGSVFPFFWREPQRNELALWPHASLQKTAVPREQTEVYSMERQQLQHTARLQKLVTDSCCSSVCTSTGLYEDTNILNIRIHKMLLGLFLQWSISLGGEKSQYSLLIFDVNKCEFFYLGKGKKKKPKPLRLTFPYWAIFPLLEAEVTSSFSTPHASTARAVAQQWAVQKGTVGSIWPSACDSPSEPENGVPPSSETLSRTAAIYKCYRMVAPRKRRGHPALPLWIRL